MNRTQIRLDLVSEISNIKELISGPRKHLLRTVLWVLNYLRKPNGAAECDGYADVVTHPEVDCMDAASNMDHLMQGFTLRYKPEEDNKRKNSDFNSNSLDFATERS